jgi:hypothetical protein
MTSRRRSLFPLGSTVSGVVQNEDVDYFVVEAKKGQRITAELEGIRLGYSFFDPFLAILNEDRFELVQNDDMTLLWQDCLCALVAPEDGKYIIQVRESAYGGSGSAFYRLHVGSFPRPTAVYPAGGRPGETLTVRWIGDPAGDWTEEITLPSLPDPEYPLLASDQHGIAPSPNVIRVVDLPNTLEVEPNDSIQQATPATVPGALERDHPGARRCRLLPVRCQEGPGLRHPRACPQPPAVASGFGVGGASQQRLGGRQQRRQRRPGQLSAVHGAGRRRLLRPHPGSPGRRGPGFCLPHRDHTGPTLADHDPARADSVCSHHAGRAAGQPHGIDGQRDQGQLGRGPECFVRESAGGMIAEPVPMTANLTSIPVLFSAAPDAPLNGTLAEVVGRSADESLGIEGRLSQRTMLVRGQNNVEVWGHTADRMAAVVSEALPFELEIVQPQSPIVRGGSKALKVVAKRQEGFNQPIAIRMLYNPPGIGSSGSISIPADQSEAEIPLTANANAAIGTWPIAVTGSATVGNGPVEAATQMAPLDIADTFMTLPSRNRQANWDSRWSSW